MTDKVAVAQQIEAAWYRLPGLPTLIIAKDGGPCRQGAGEAREEGMSVDESRRLQAQVAAVKALHRPFGIYDECGHEHEEGQAGVLDIPEVGLTCEAGLLYTVCRECHTYDGWRKRTRAINPCATVRILEERGSDE